MNKLDKIIKTLGNLTVTEMEAMDETGLKKTIVDASQAMKEVAEELENNPKYQRLKDDLKFLSEAKKEVNKRQKAKVALALHLLSEKGKEPSSEE